MKCLTFLFLKFLFLPDFVIAETIPTKSEILRQSGNCITDFRPKACKELVSEIEKLQIVEFDQNRFKCQSSLLGMQSAIIEVDFLKNSSNERISFMIPYMIKNC